MAMRAAACLSGMLARQRARRSAPPSLTTSIARSNTYSSDRDAHHCRSSFDCDADINAFKERSLLRRRGVPFGW